MEARREQEELFVMTVILIMVVMVGNILVMMLTRRRMRSARSRTMARISMKKEGAEREIGMGGMHVVGSPWPRAPGEVLAAARPPDQPPRDVRAHSREPLGRCLGPRRRALSVAKALPFRPRRCRSVLRSSCSDGGARAARGWKCTSAARFADYWLLVEPHTMGRLVLAPASGP